MFSQGVKAGQHVYVSGLVGVDVKSGDVAGATIQEQTRQALTNCQAVLAAAGATLDDVVEGMNEEYANWFPAGPPARYAAKLGAEIPGILVSIRMTAFVG